MNPSLPTAMTQRASQIMRALPGKNLDGLIINQPAYIFHLTGWLPPTWAAVFLILSTNRLVLVSPFLPELMEPAWDKAFCYTGFSLNELVQPEPEALLALGDAMNELGLHGRKIGFSQRTLPAAYAIPLSNTNHLHDATDIMFALTAIKDELALSQIRRREAMLDTAFEHAARIIQPDMTEIELFGQLYSILASELGSPFTLDCDLGSGDRTLLDEPQPTPKKLKNGETVLIDLFPNLGGYVADYTRNFIVGKPSADQQKQHHVLETALARAEKLLRPGVSASDIDHAVRGVIEEAGYGDFIHQHHSGHAFGLLAPEPPIIIPANPARLQAGMVIAIEPGIYHPHSGGMRLEGNYLITDAGSEILHGTPAHLMACG